jgi:hypothetical protein
VLWTRSFTAPVALLALERFPPDLRLLLEGLRAPLDDARFDCDRLLRDAVRERELDEPERGLALAPLLLEPLRPDAERERELPLRLDELRRPAEPLLCPDFELPWAILASLILGFAWVGPSLPWSMRAPGLLRSAPRRPCSPSTSAAPAVGVATAGATSRSAATAGCGPARSGQRLFARHYSPSLLLGVCGPYPNPLQGNRCKPAINGPAAFPTVLRARGIDIEGAYRRWRCPA